jgi:phosphoglucosamine mutase
MAVVAQSWKEEGRLSRPGIVATVMSNYGLERYLNSIGLSLERTAVGDRYVLEYMREHNFNVGGEQSGHIILSDYSTTGDGLVAALQVLAVVRRLEKPVSQVCRPFQPLPQILKNVRVADRNICQSDDVKTAISQAETKIASKGRLLIRPSGTEPLIRVMAEGEDRSFIEPIVDDLCALILKKAS